MTGLSLAMLDRIALWGHKAWTSLHDRAMAGQRARFIARAASEPDRLISVIMTCYNNAENIIEAVDSILAQSHQNFELLVLDDASSDEGLAALIPLAQADKRLKLFRGRQNHGTYWLKNWAIKQAKGEFITFHDSDDRSLPDRLALQMGALLTLRAAACTVRWQRFMGEDKELVIDGRLRRLAAISLMIRRAVLVKEMGFFDSVRVAADSEYLGRLRAMLGEKSLKRLSHMAYWGQVRAGSLTTAQDSGMHWTRRGPFIWRRLEGDRAVYLQNARRWHRTGALHALDFPLSKRPFEAPLSLIKGADDPDLTSVERLPLA